MMRRLSWRGLAGQAQNRGKVLVVDDDPEIRKSLTRLLAHVGYTVRSVGSAEEADQVLASERHDVCLLDIALPRMSGVDFLPWAEARDPEMAVIMLTGVDEPDVALKCMEEGARTFLVKPVETPFLLRAIRDALALRSLLVQHNLNEGPRGGAGEALWPASS